MYEYHRCYAVVDLAAIEHNIDQIRDRIGNNTLLTAIVKADAYGHGAVPVAQKIEKKVNAFGVAAYEEGLALREAGIRAPVLVLGYSSPRQYAEMILHNVTPSVYDYEDARILSETAVRMNVMAKLHIPLDTGMSRIGFPATEETVEKILKISGLPNLFIEGIFSHLSCADMEEDSVSARQFAEFDAVNAGLEKAGFRIPIRHICNSAGIFRYDSHYADSVRAGIILYGLLPSEEVGSGGLDLRPALSWKTHVIRVEEIPKGRGISYGATFVTQKDMTRIATIAIGYADGYPRSLSNTGRVLIHGKYATITGRVCMDICMADVTDIPDVKVEDEVTLLGNDGNECISAEQLGNMAGSFNYETVCRISKRVKRIYTNE